MRLVTLSKKDYKIKNQEPPKNDKTIVLIRRNPADDDLKGKQI